MSRLYSFCNEINLHVKGRISIDDARRQEKTTKEILRRLEKQPGVILADEVGMGKTFVALAVAVSVALKNRGKRPVAVMVPSSLKEKWPSDFSLFCEKCLPENLSQKIRFGKAERAVEFLKLLDDPPHRRKSVIFLTHGAMSRGLNDHWVMLALIRQSLYRRHGVDRLRNSLCRNMPKLLHELKWVGRSAPEIWKKLLSKHPKEWLSILDRNGIELDDDPVPEAVWKVLPKLDTENVLDSLHAMPLRRSKNSESYLLNARRVIKSEVRGLWKECLTKTKIRLPLLILDEAHHLKNSKTRLASLFHSEESRDDANEISRGPLASVFERMLFLTATPFQLGHGELCSVLDRFDGINWKGVTAPPMGIEGFANRKGKLRAALDSAQECAVTLDHTWGRLRPEDLVVDGESYGNAQQWWSEIQNDATLTQPAIDVRHCFERTKEHMALAEKQLRKWIIRHLKQKTLPCEDAEIPRRIRFVGQTILPGYKGNPEQGICVTGEALLPFLLAARATSQAPEARPVFAEGLASSYEAFLHTRKNRKDATDDDDDELKDFDPNDSMRWYLNHLERMIPHDGKVSVRHPKIGATVDRVVDIWRQGEKAVVFCHYIATGRILRQRISEAISKEVRLLGAAKLGLPLNEVPAQLELIGKRFFDEDSPIRRACDAESNELLSDFPDLMPYRKELLSIVRRNVRTPSFLARFFPLDSPRLNAEAMREALSSEDLSGLTLRKLLNQFFSFLVERCGNEQRERYIEAVNRIQTGSHFGADVSSNYTDDELQGAKPEQLIPNVRLVNGTTRSDTRQRIMLTFNTPFYPEILVASSVMAEGVDLHLNCRYVIHHDLCWNPSTLEQRSGRVDRIGAKSERAKKPIHIYLPFVAETQDEKIYRVVMDRERWFNIVMGEDYKIDLRTTDKLALRIPFPVSAANELAFKLGVM